MESYPFRNEFYSDSDRLSTYEKLKSERLSQKSDDELIKYHNVNLDQIDYLYRGQYHYLMYDSKKYELYMLSDLFNDKCRSKCSFGKNPTPFDYFENNKEKIKSALEKKGLKPTPLNVREEIYAQTKECSIHNPLIITHFMEKFDAKIVGDFSTGWGDRLIGFMIGNGEFYFGTDPNECLIDGYHQMIKLLKPQGNIQMIPDGFQNVEFPKFKEFDLIYTSPPYFDYETYGKGEKQSINLGKTENEWLEKFLYPSLEKCIYALKNGGHLVLYFSQERGKTYIEKFMRWMKKLYDVYYLGNIFYSDLNKKGIHPIFIFEKNNRIPVSLYNPPLKIKPYELDYDHHKIKIRVIRDDCLIGGTKSRPAIGYINALIKPNTNELLYLGASNGYAPVAFAHALNLMKSSIKLRIYSQHADSKDVYDLRKLAKTVYPDITYVVVKQPFKEIWPQIDSYLESNPNSVLIPFGLHDEIFTGLLHDMLIDYLKPCVDKIKRLWVVVGSGALFEVLYKILPLTHFCLVRVGKEINVDKFDSTRFTLYNSSYKMYQVPDFNIPYPTTKSFDGKIWEFEKEFKDGDYIWNVGGIHEKI